ncbi:MAG: oligosaccharide flippase family protein [Salibacteraceae bacterium]
MLIRILNKNKKSLIATLLKGGGILTSYAFAFVVSKKLGVDAFGRFSIWLSMLTILTGIITLGLDKAILKAVAESFIQKDDHRIRKLMTTSTAFVLISATLVAAVIGLFSPFITRIFYGDSTDAIYIEILAVSIPALALLTVFGQAIRGLDLTNTYVLLDHGFRYLLPIPIITLLFSFNGYALETQAFSVGLILLVFYALFLLRGHFSIRGFLNLASHKVTMKQLLHIGLPLMVANVAILFKGWSDTLILAYLTDDVTVGYFNVSMKLAKLVSLPLVANNAAIAVTISGLLLAKEKSNLKDYYFKTVKRLSVFSAMLFIGVLVFHNQLLSQFNSNSDENFIALSILAASFLIGSIFGPVGLMLHISHFQKHYLRISVVMALASVALNFILIPFIGLIGAALSALVVQVIWNGWSFYYTRKLFTEL